MKFDVKAIAAAVGLSVVAASPAAKADHWMATADPTVLNAINELMYVLGASCQAGNPQACQAIPLLQQDAAMILSAGYDCQVYRNAQACQFYQASLVALNQTYAATAQALAQGRLAQPGGSYSQSSHLDRMQQIHDWGASRLDWGASQMDMMESRQQTILDSIWD